MKKNSLSTILGMALGAGALLPNQVYAGGELRVSNLSSSISGNKVRYIENGDNGGYNPNGNPPSLEIFDEDNLAVPRLVRGIDVSTNNVLCAPLVYNGNVTNGTPNNLRFRFYNNLTNPSITNNFPSDLIITAKVQTYNYTNAIDVVKAIDESGVGYFDLALPDVINAVAGNRYGTNLVSFVRKDSISPSIESLVINGDGSVNLNVTNALAGASYTPQFSTNMLDWTNLTNNTSYVQPNIDNFAIPTSLTISNVSMSGESENPQALPLGFYRVKVE